MAIEVEYTEATRCLQEHERIALSHVRDALSTEEGFLIAGHFIPRDRKLPPQEIDGILVLPDLVLLLELKSRHADRIQLLGLDRPMRRWHEGVPSDECNPLADMEYISRAIKSRLVKAGFREITVQAVFIADAYGRPLKLEVGPQRRPWGVESGIAACQPQDIVALLAEIRQRSARVPPKYPLSAADRKRLQQILEAVRNTTKPVAQERIGDFLLLRRVVFEEADVIVYYGKETDTNEPVWLKAYRRDLLATGTDASLDRVLVLRDAVALVTIGDHPNIVRYKTKVDCGEYIYIVLRREPGCFLREKMGSLSWVEKLHILADILAALAHIHGHQERGRTALCRDLRPESIFITASGHAQIFGLDCSRLPGRATVFERATRRAQRWRAYASPELLNAQSPEQVDTPSDIYSWGVVAYELLSGQLPYPDERRALQGKLRPLKDFRIPIPPALQEVIEKSLAPDATVRPTLAQIQVALQEAIDGIQ